MALRIAALRINIENNNGMRQLLSPIPGKGNANRVNSFPQA
jgi:hypothetical protein